MAMGVRFIVTGRSTEWIILRSSGFIQNTGKLIEFLQFYYHDLVSLKNIYIC